MAGISIIIPVYNAERYIRRCLGSVLRQTYQDFRVILVNDGSTDDSLALCRGYSDPRFVVLDKENGGAASARNAGLDWYYQNEPSDWMCFLDIDDFIHERYLELLLSAAEETGASISMCSYESTTKDALEPSEIDAKAVRVGVEQLWCERQINCTIPWAKLFSKEIFRTLRFPEGIIHEDEFVLYRALFQVDTIAFLDCRLYGYYQTQTSVMRGDWTPRHMTEPDGLNAQLRFFRENHYDRAASYTAKIYLFSLHNNLQRCRKAGAQYADCARTLKNRLRKELPRLKKTAGVSVETEPWLFYEAVPVRMIPHKIGAKLKKRRR